MPKQINNSTKVILCLKTRSLLLFRKHNQFDKFPYSAKLNTKFFNQMTVKNEIARHRQPHLNLYIFD